MQLEQRVSGSVTDKVSRPHSAAEGPALTDEGRAVIAGEQISEREIQCPLFQVWRHGGAGLKRTKGTGLDIAVLEGEGSLGMGKKHGFSFEDSSFNHLLQAHRRNHSPVHSPAQLRPAGPRQVGS